ncbi:heme biosynthesis HemY N-terminal domain-containing protein [Pollutimonas bauzanensis]|uniref:HemY protein n=1 Tax=Pollutimonas bauzanensis TaxID=658167 RepID=A0A1M5MF39_9BURK|nr:heme biosynthesis HemY N-terminal domain-containing protein [Pollutimonas bauzanensis]SHG75782.1 HemY protein [Pollutimonas bauzanensis]
MRTWFWTLLVFVAAVALALVLRDHSGNVLIMAQPWRIELSLTLAVLLVLATFIILYVVLRVLAWISGGPERFRSWRSLRAQNRDHKLLESGWINVLEGRYTEAEKELSKLLGRTRSSSRKVLAGLASARASHHLGEFTRRDQALALAQESAGNDPRLREAAATVAAEMYLDQNRPQDALVLLQPLQDASSRYFHATRLLLRAHRQLRNHDRVYELTRLLLRRGVIEKAEAMQLIETSAAARLHAAGAEGFKSIWGDLKADERSLPDIALAGAAIQEAEGNYEEASRILEAAIGARLEPRLLNAYSQCPPEFVARRLSKAEVWLKNHPDDSALLAALGNLCLTGQLWGQGEHYLLRSMKIRSDMRIHALLGNLYDRLGRPADAMKHWRLASGVAGVLPVLPVSRALPAADTRGDPTLIDVESLPEPDMPQTDPAPVAASAADFMDDDAAGSAPLPAAPPADRPAPGAAQSSSSPDTALDEYFDSAPIPGVDLSQTSDRPRRGPGQH